MDIIQALADVAWYNGWSKTLCDVKTYLDFEIKKPHDRFSVIGFPDFLDEFKCDLYPRVIWSVMVLMFGNYGTSPRYGWIERSKADKAVEWLNSVCKLIPEELPDDG